MPIRFCAAIDRQAAIAATEVPATVKAAEIKDPAYPAQSEVMPAAFASLIVASVQAGKTKAARPIAKRKARGAKRGIFGLLIYLYCDDVMMLWMDQLNVVLSRHDKRCTLLIPQPTLPPMPQTAYRLPKPPGSRQLWRWLHGRGGRARPVAYFTVSFVIWAS